MIPFCTSVLIESALLAIDGLWPSNASIREKLVATGDFLVIHHKVEFQAHSCHRLPPSGSISKHWPLMYTVQERNLPMRMVIASETMMRQLMRVWQGPGRWVVASRVRRWCSLTGGCGGGLYSRLLASRSLTLRRRANQSSELTHLANSKFLACLGHSRCLLQSW